MSNHMVVNVDTLMRPVSLPTFLAEVENMSSESPEPYSLTTAREDNAIDIYDGDNTTEEENSLISSAECRICQDECDINNLESPCACNGSLKYVHRKCVQRWCNEKGNTICEICHQPYQAGYTSPPPPPQSEEITIDIGGGWTISGLDLHDQHLLALAEAERQILESEYDDYTAVDNNGAAFFRSASLILMTLLLLRNALTIPDSAYGEDDISSILSIFLLRAACFLLPCYIMASAISILHRRREREEAAALATGFALVLRSRRPRAVVNYVSTEP